MKRSSPDPADDFRYEIALDEDPSQATFLAVGEATDRDALELPPLGRTIDTDSLDTLLRGSPDPRKLTVTFEYADCSVKATPSEIRVRPL